MKRNSEIDIDDQPPKTKKIKGFIQFLKEDNSLKHIHQSHTCPWLKPYVKTLSPAIRLHNQIIHFCQYIAPTQEQHQFRLQIFKKVKQYIEQEISQCEIILFGSLQTKVYLPGADIDIIVNKPNISDRHLYQQVARIIRNNKQFDKVTLIRNAKVPIIKFVQNQSNLQFDVSINQKDGAKQVSEVLKAFNIYPHIAYLMFVIKCFLQQRELHQTYSGGIGSFLLFCMILAFLREFKKGLTKRKFSQVLLSELLIKFFQFYGVSKEWNQYQISMLNGGSIKQKFSNNDFSLKSPLNEEQDIGSASFKIKQIFTIFRNRYNFLLNYSFNQSIKRNILIYQNSQMISYIFNYQQMEHTFIMVKPDGVQRRLVGQIIKRFQNRGFSLVAMKLIATNQEIVKKHYQEHVNKNFFPGLLNYMLTGPVVIMVWEGKEIIKIARKIIGQTNPKNAEIGTIRGDYCIDTGRNVIHGSDSKQSAQKQIKLWFKPQQIIKFHSHSNPWIYE